MVRGEVGRIRSEWVSLWVREPAARRPATAAVMFCGGVISWM